MLHGEAVVLTDMLDCRERRSCKQEEYRNKYHTTVISFCMNIPGPVKTNPDISKVFQSGVQDILSFLQSSDIKILESPEYNEKTGNELLLAIDSTDSKHIKNAMTHIEETHPLGRLFDIDVINPDGIKMSRNTFRKCFICNCQAQECASARKHSVPEMQEYIDSKIQEYLKSDTALDYQTK